MTSDQIIWDVWCTRFGFEKSDFGAAFVSRGTAYRITGIAPNRPRYPISAERVAEGRAFKFDALSARSGLPKKVAA